MLAAYRPTGKGRVERQVNINRDHVITGRSLDSIAELDGAFQAWLPIRRAQVHRTHGQVIAVRAEADFPSELLDGLRAKGHRVEEMHSTDHGAVQIIHIDRARGILVGGSDPRADGLALGW